MYQRPEQRLAEVYRVLSPVFIVDLTDSGKRCQFVVVFDNCCVYFDVFVLF